MDTIQIQLDRQTLARAQLLSRLRGYSLDALIKELINQTRVAALEENHLLGMFADEPQLMDQVVESSMIARERHALRSTGE